MFFQIQIHAVANIYIYIRNVTTTTLHFFLTWVEYVHLSNRPVAIVLIIIITAKCSQITYLFSAKTSDLAVTVSRLVSWFMPYMVISSHFLSPLCWAHLIGQISSTCLSLFISRPASFSTLPDRLLSCLSERRPGLLSWLSVWTGSVIWILNLEIPADSCDWRITWTILSPFSAHLTQHPFLKQVFILSGAFPGGCL